MLLMCALTLVAAVTQVDLTAQVKGILPTANGGTEGLPETTWSAQRWLWLRATWWIFRWPAAAAQLRSPPA
jgi:hypothetical protein